MNIKRVTEILKWFDSNPMTRTRLLGRGAKENEVDWLLRSGFLAEVSTENGFVFYSVNENGTSLLRRGK